MTQRRIEIEAPPDVAFERLESAWASIGKIEDSNKSVRTLTGKARYGLNPVRVRISVISNGDSSVLDIQGRGQDVWGAASRKVIDRLIDALGAQGTD